MAQKVQIIMTCDLDEEVVEAETTTHFGFEGLNYSFELCSGHLEAMRELMEPYIAGARRENGAGRRTRQVPSATPKEDLAAIRQWAKENGYKVSERGRIAQYVKDAYAAQPVAVG